MDVLEFRDRIMQHIMEMYPESREYAYTPEDIAGIEKLRDEKFMTWDWNFGTSPHYDFSKMIRTEGGSIEFHFNVKKGLITDMRIFGDFFHKNDIEEIEKSLVGVNHEHEAIAQTLSKFDFNSYFKNIKLNEFVDGMFWGQKDINTAKWVKRWPIVEVQSMTVDVKTQFPSLIEEATIQQKETYFTSLKLYYWIIKLIFVMKNTSFLLFFTQ